MLLNSLNDNEVISIKTLGSVHLSFSKRLWGNSHMFLEVIAEEWQTLKIVVPSDFGDALSGDLQSHFELNRHIFVDYGLGILTRGIVDDFIQIAGCHI